MPNRGSRQGVASSTDGVRNWISTRVWIKLRVVRQLFVTVERCAIAVRYSILYTVWLFVVRRSSARLINS